MREYRFALATLAATFSLLVVGGLVHATGSSLACPDWPLCYGQFFPRMVGGVLFEHGHRLLALAVALLATTLAVLVFRARRDRAARGLAALAVVLVVIQAVLGGLTVIYRLPTAISSTHLATSMAFFSTLIVLAHRLRPARLDAPRPVRAAWWAWRRSPPTSSWCSGRWSATPVPGWPATPPSRSATAAGSGPPAARRSST